MKTSHWYLLYLFLFTPLISAGQDPTDIDIVRDQWGVPHIFSKTDGGVAYGLAWANAEDDFKTIQLGFLASKAMLGRYTGKDGATVDYIIQLLQCRELVDARYDTDLSPAFKKVLEGYCKGLNAYARTHPRDVLVSALFPITPKDMVTYSVFELTILSGADEALGNIANGTVATATFKPGGSNGYAFNSKKTKDGSVYLAINSHQPLSGPVSWYEAHLCSEEGWNILGALFPGAPVILHGCNENLGWAHTVNNPDKLDTYQLELNPQNPKQYKYDGSWQTLEEKTVRLHVKVAGIVIPVKKKIYKSMYGPAMLTRKGAFSIRTGALMDVRPLQQWYEMNKAKNYSSFRKALDLNAINGFNIVYADRFDTIYYLSNARMPVRNPAFHWSGTLPGNTASTRWTTFHPVSDLPQLLQPSSGYLFNSNNTPFNATAPDENLLPAAYDETMGYEKGNNNRSLRFMELMRTYQKVGFDDFKKIKYDRQLPEHLAYKPSGDSLFTLSETENPDVADVLHDLKSWDRNANVESTAATVFAVIYYKVADDQMKGVRYAFLTKQRAIEMLRYTRAYLLKNFGKTSVPLGEFQKLVRGKKSVPLPGIPDVISAMRSVPWAHGRVKGEQGESYIELIRFTPTGPEIESVNCYGASNDPKSPHYADQMEMFVNQKTKPMTLHKDEVYQKAKKIYHPN